MTLICSKEDVDKLIREMSYWGSDPDLLRIADALPIEVLEAAYVAKLGRVSADVPEQAESVRQKVSVLRCVLGAWLRRPQQRLGQLFANSVVLSLPSVPDDALALNFTRAYTPKE